MAENQKKEAIHNVLTKVKASRGALGLEAGGTKSTDLSSALSEAWQSPKAEEIEGTISSAITDLSTQWESAESTAQTDHDGELDDVEEGSVEARWFSLGGAGIGASMGAVPI